MFGVFCFSWQYSNTDLFQLRTNDHVTTHRKSLNLDICFRFCGQEFTLDKFDAQFHLSNNSVQKNYKNGERSEHLPDSNMWTNEQFKKHLYKKGIKT